MLRKNIKIIKENGKFNKMNICLIIGKIISEIEYRFLLKSKNISIVKFIIQLNNNSKVTVKAYDEIADECYRKLTKNQMVSIQGKINSNMEIEVEEINFLV